MIVIAGGIILLIIAIACFSAGFSTQNRKHLSKHKKFQESIKKTFKK